MSYILDALRKADQERSIGDVPDLDAPHWSQRRGGSVRPWVWVVIALFVVNSVLLAMLFNREGSSSVPTASLAGSDRGTPPSRPVVRSRLQPADTDTASPQRATLPARPLSQVTRTVIATPRQEKAPVVDAAEPAAVNVPRTTGGDGGAVSSPRAQRAPAVSRPRVAQPAAADKARKNAAGIPDWNELSLEFRSGFNPPRLDVHVYDEQPSRRFILVELKRYVEGDTLPGGARLEKILPGSIQLYYQDTRFRIDR